MIDNLQDLMDLLQVADGITINLNDFFEYSTADSLTIDYKDLEWVLPIYNKYKWDGLHAAASYIVQTTPLKEHLSDNFTKAYLEIKTLNPIIYTEY